MTNKTLLCFDYGTKRIGVAVGQSITNTASPLETIKVHNNKPDWDRIEHLIENWCPEALIVGVPLQMDDKKQEITLAAEKFTRQLKSRFHLPVYGVDERLSTFEALLRKKKKSALDPVAAQAILETWLTENNNKITPLENGKINNE